MKPGEHSWRGRSDGWKERRVVVHQMAEGVFALTTGPMMIVLTMPLVARIPLLLVVGPMTALLLIVVVLGPIGLSGRLVSAVHAEWGWAGSIPTTMVLLIVSGWLLEAARVGEALEQHRRRR